MSECAFCKIVRQHEESPLPWVIDHTDVISFRPFGPVNPGHRMFIPKRHVVDAAEDPVVTGHCFEGAAIWGQQRNEPFNLVVNSGAIAGQSVFHLHIHYVPRAEGDELGYRWKRGQE